MESWAEGVETIVTNDRYLAINSSYRSTEPRDRALNLARWGAWRQELTAAEMNEYTPIVEDLIDDINQNEIPNYAGVQPIDDVSDYTLQQIQSALKGSRSANTWRNRLNANRPSGVTSAELNT